MRRCLAVMAAAVAVLLTTPHAFACTFVPRSAEQHFDAADAVFVGRVLERELVPPGTWVRAAFAVDRVLKGTVPRETLVHTRSSGKECGVALSEGKAYAVFAASRRGDLYVSANDGTTHETDVLDGLDLQPVAVYPLSGPDPRPRDARSGVIAAASLVAGVAGAGSVYAWRKRARARTP